MRTARNDLKPVQSWRHVSEPRHPKPLLRGAFHASGFFVALVASILCLQEMPSGIVRLSTTVYCVSLLCVLGTSGLYHRVYWPDRVLPWIKRIDHVMIFFLIAGTYTPLSLLTIGGTTGTWLFRAIWSIAAAGLIFKLVFIHAPKWLTGFLYVAMGWFGAAAMPAVYSRLPEVPVLMAAGGVMYSLGAGAYALRWPNPNPKIFGYHEVLHSLVCVAMAIHFYCVFGYVVPNYVAGMQ
eukprot:TRINITY_DN15914_c0_g1_i1.p1 TRINITY_DN15914_c0_g1~~TRINITY_DN15914_c0_g1_i1.p1  ORF type:complete len:237 (-),score=38.39 TRINITY_DN15914_c0_g1_i1:65-775(-)